jgi:serine/threonine protein kinase
MKPGDVVTVRDEDEDAGTAAIPSRLGHFEIVGRLGAGGMGLVFEGRDTVLDRRVALKLLHPATANGLVAPARLLREAQALAKLQHPNVVTVYEVGTVGADRFIAMELVEGTTLFEWMATPRDWREVLAMFIAVGNGLAAVHALGLVHRDVKPSNILVDKHGLPKLGDFGLVGAIDDPDEPRAPSSSDPGLTTPGAAMGTPAYMAPEQKRGEPVDARADQFSFAKSLREALGDTVPSAVEPILARAMAEEPDDRYPSMAPLLADLARVRRGRARWWIAAGALAAIAIAVVAAWSFGRTSASVEDPCGRPTARVDAVWGSPRRTALEAHLAAIDPAFGKQRFALASPVLDGGATRWQDLHVEACQLSRDGRQSDAMLDRRMACLDQALFELDETVQALEATTDGKTLDSATRAATTLPTLEACADTAALAERVPLPTNPLKRAEAEALARELIDIDVTRRATGTRGVGDRATKAVQRARLLEHPESLANALRVLAAIQHDNEQFGLELAALREGVVAAAAAHDDRLVAELWSKQLAALIAAETPKEAVTLMPAAEAANARITAPLELRSRFVASKAQVLGVMRDIPEARKQLDAMIAELTAAKLTSHALSLRRTRIDIAEMAREFPAMEKETRELIPVLEAAHGKDHPDVGEMRRLHGVALFSMRKFPEAQVELLEAVRIGESRLAPSPKLATLFYNVGAVLEAMEQPDQGRPYMTRALAMARATLPADDLRLAPFVMGMAVVSSDDETIKKGFLETLAILEKGPRPNQRIATVLFNLGRLEQEQRKFEAAIALYERSVKERVARGGADKTPLAITHASIAECQYALERFPAAVEASALALEETAHPVILAQAHFTHGMARVRAGDAAGRAEVATARAELAKLGAPPPTL